MIGFKREEKSVTPTSARDSSPDVAYNVYIVFFVNSLNMVIFHFFYGGFHAPMLFQRLWSSIFFFNLGWFGWAYVRKT